MKITKILNARLMGEVVRADVPVVPTVHITMVVVVVQAALMVHITMVAAVAQAVPMAPTIMEAEAAEVAHHNVATIVILAVMMIAVLDVVVDVTMLAIAATQCVVMVQRALAQVVAHNVKQTVPRLALTDVTDNQKTLKLWHRLLNNKA